MQSSRQTEEVAQKHSATENTSNRKEASLAWSRETSPSMRESLPLIRELCDEGIARAKAKSCVWFLQPANRTSKLRVQSSGED
jgi:hypothetical protein